MSFVTNFGDDLVEKISARLCGEQEIRFCGPDYIGRKALIGGSTMGSARNKDIVWGAGIRDGHLDPAIRDLSVFSVRGLLTARILRERGMDVADCYGDPAILLPRLFPELKPTAVETQVGIVPHFSEMGWIGKQVMPGGARLISPVQDAFAAIREIRTCRRIVASSLHGIICAEALGIPVEPYRTRGAEREPDFKYEDYFSATGRDWKPHNDYHHALEGKFRHPPCVSDSAEKLLKAFYQMQEYIKMHNGFVQFV